MRPPVARSRNLRSQTSIPSRDRKGAVTGEPQPNSLQRWTALSLTYGRGCPADLAIFLFPFFLFGFGLLFVGLFRRGPSLRGGRRGGCWLRGRRLRLGGRAWLLRG